MAASTSNACLSSDSFKIPAEPCPLPSLGSDEESFVVLWKDMDSKSFMELNHDPIGTGVVEEAKQLINKELSEMEQMSLANKAEVQADDNLTVDGPSSQMESDVSVVDQSTILPKMPQVEKGLDTSAEVISITTLSTDLSSEQVQKKVSEIVEENIRLKDTILQNNMSMKSQYDRIVAWQEDVQKVHQAHKEKILEAKEFIERLKKENYNLIRELDQAKACKKVQEEEIASLKEQLTDQKLRDENKLNRTTDNNLKEFELDVANRKVKELELAMKNLAVENMTLKEDKVRLASGTNCTEAYKNEIARLEAALSASKKETEEAKTELAQLKSKHEEEVKFLKETNATLQSQLFFTSQQQNMLPSPEEVANIRQQLASTQVILTQVEQGRTVACSRIEELNKEIAELKEKMQGSQSQADEIFALNAQLDVYKADFEAERNAKETIKTEKERIAEDMQNLQRRNQQLQEEIEMIREKDYVMPPSPRRERVESTAATASSSSSGSPPLRRFACPICNLQFRTLRLVEDHVETCIAHRA